ncbi:hypothetical protein E9529_11720 [Blastococcus sp. KM273128]|uniref:hypothetical protein n=1 Tax=Blastococcus sp. KM273128 TaxID=2570314 RepID=UPI001F426D2E|nr:hypothetical protein [Blastococcus sp. KM273128]MCF6744939.1 hypothetical protein [Blastococcus sp. KM273128]
MSHRTTTRVAATTGLAVVTASLGLAFAPSALAADLPAVEAPSTVVAGEKFTISGVGCYTRDEEFGATVGIITDSGSQKLEEVVFAAEPANDGTWSAEVFFPVGDAGDHLIDITCLNVYLGVEEEQFYPIVEIEVTAPVTDTPVTDGPKTDAPKTETPTPGAIRGESANTAGVAAQTTGAVTKNAVLGQKVVKVYKGFKPFEKVTLTMHSTPTVIGTFDADADGVVTAEFALPAGTTAGTHTLVLEGNQGTYFQESLQVAAATTAADGLAYTGASIALPLSLGAGLLAAGAGALVVSRRRSGASQA